MGILTTISKALRDLSRERLLTELATEIQRPGTFMKNWALEFFGVLVC